MHLVVGVVAEGPTDVVVLDEYLAAWVRELDDSVTLEVRPLQPAVAARWRSLARRTRTRLAHIKSVCPYCERFLSYFEAAVNEQG